jgi:ABC-type amino acid transport substrate-binding protein
MSQHMPDRSPRRWTDGVLVVVGWVVAALAVLTVVCAGVAAASAYRGGLDRIARDAAARTTVVGVLLDDAAPVGSGPVRPARVSYVDPQGRAHVGQISVTGRLVAGTPVRVEVDGDGRIGVQPPSRADAVVAAVIAGLGVSLLGLALLPALWCGARCAVARHNHAAWEREWRLVEPQWSGRGTAAP